MNKKPLLVRAALCASPAIPKHISAIVQAMLFHEQASQSSALVSVHDRCLRASKQRQECCFAPVRGQAMELNWYCNVNSMTMYSIGKSGMMTASKATAFYLKPLVDKANLLLAAGQAWPTRRPPQQETCAQVHHSAQAGLMCSSPKHRPAGVSALLNRQHC